MRLVTEGAILAQIVSPIVLSPSPQSVNPELRVETLRMSYCGLRPFRCLGFILLCIQGLLRKGNT